MPKRPPAAGNLFDAARLKGMSVSDPMPDRAFKIRSKYTLTMIARALIVNHMDFDKAVYMLFPTDTPERRLQTVDYLQAHPDLRAEIEEQFKLVGLDDGSKDAYVKELFAWFWGADNELKMTAARILGRAFIADKVVDKPAVLEIKGIEDGVARMLGTNEISAEPVEEEKLN